MVQSVKVGRHTRRPSKFRHAKYWFLTVGTAEKVAQKPIVDYDSNLDPFIKNIFVGKLANAMISGMIAGTMIFITKDSHLNRSEGFVFIIVSYNIKSPIKQYDSSRA